MNQAQKDARRNAEQAMQRTHRGAYHGLRRVAAQELGLVRATVKVASSDVVAFGGAVAPTDEAVAGMRTETYYGRAREVGFEEGRRRFDGGGAAHDGRDWLGRMVRRVEEGA
jgi:hypothetical protein